MQPVPQVHGGELVPVTRPSAVNPSPSIASTSGAAKSLYVGNLSCFVTEVTLHDIFSTLGKIAECKVIKDKQTGLPAGYAFVRFEDHRSAELALTSINGRVLYNQELRVNWAFQKEQTEDTSAHFHIFVGDLSAEINDFSLRQAFDNYSECSDARVLWDHLTGRSKGYGFVSFRTKEAADDAIRTFHGQYIGHRKVKCSWAQHKQDPSANDYVTVDHSDPSNSNVYVGNLAPNATDEELRELFAIYGVVLEVKMYRKGSYAFVNFQTHDEAVKAIVSLNGQIVKGKPLKCAWGRHQARQSPMNLTALSMTAPILMQQQQGYRQAPSLSQLQQQMAQMSLGMHGQPPSMQQPDQMNQPDLSYLYNPHHGSAMLPPPQGLLPPQAALLPPPAAMLPPAGGLSNMYYHQGS